MLSYHAEVSYKLGKVTIKYNPCESTVQPVLQQSTIQRQKYFGAAFVGNHVHHALHPASTHRLSYVQMELLSSHCPNFLREALHVAERYDRLIAEFAVTAESDISQNSHSQLHDGYKLIEKTKFKRLACLHLERRSSGAVVASCNIIPHLHLLEHHVPHCAVHQIASASVWACLANKTGKA